MSDISTPTEISRRKFLGNVVKGIGALVGVAVAAPLIGYFLSPAWSKSKTLVIAIANVNEIPVGEPTLVTYEQRVREGWYISTLSKAAWVVTKNGKDFTVFDPHCTHLSCPYYWDKDKKVFLCPCHNGVFDIDGKVTGGPPPRPLDRLESSVDGGALVVTGNIIRGG